MKGIGENSWTVSIVTQIYFLPQQSCDHQSYFLLLINHWKQILKPFTKAARQN